MDGLVLGTNTKDASPVILEALARSYGLYLIGATGSGKTSLLLNLIMQDIHAGRGVCVVDPHGDLTTNILKRAGGRQDIVLFDPLRLSCPIGLNIFSCEDLSDPTKVQATVEHAIHVFHKIWEDSWGDRLEGLLRHCAYTLVELDLTMMEIPALLTDDMVRTKLVDKLENDLVKKFWKKQYSVWPVDWRESTLNKVEEFLLNPLIRPIVSQRRSMDFRTIIDEGKVLLVRLPVGLLKDNPVTLLGSVIISQLVSSATSREDIPEEERTPFFLYADEFHRFATSDFATLMDEARKYGIGTTIAHQRLTQLSYNVRGAVLSIPNRICFQVGEDAQPLAQAFDATPPDPAVSGQRPILSLVPQAARYLAFHTHKNKRIEDFVRKYIAPIAVRAGIEVNEEMTYVNMNPSDRWHPSYVERWHSSIEVKEQKRYDRMLEVLDDFFLECMSKGESWTESLCQTMGIACWEFVRQVIAANHLTVTRKEFIEEFTAVCQALVREPVEQPSGRYETTYDRPLTTDEMHDRIANELAGLPLYTAKVKLRNGTTFFEAVIEAKQAEKGSPADLTLIRRQTCSEYGTPLQEIEREIRDRVPQDLPKPPPLTKQITKR